MYTLLTFLILGAAILVHELGHFVAARIFRVHVYKLSLFFSPGFSLIEYDPLENTVQFIIRERKYVENVDGREVEQTTRKSMLQLRLGREHYDAPPTSWRNTVYILGWLPLGGYCSLADQIVRDHEDIRPGTLASKRPWQRIIISLAGVFSNLITAFIALVAIFYFWTPITIEQTSQNVAAVIVVDSEQGLPDGLNPGDTIIAVNGRPVSNPQEFENLSRSTDAPVYTISDSEGNRYDMPLSASAEIPVGIPHPRYRFVKHHHDLGFAFTTAIRFGGHSIAVIARHPIILFNGRIEQINETGNDLYIVDYSLWTGILWSFAIISILLAIFNILPIPGLDGSRIILPLYEIFSRSRAPARAYNFLNTLGSITIAALFIYFIITIILG